MMPDLDLDRMEDLADAATEGPWFQGRGDRRFENPREVYSKREPEEPDAHDIATFVWSDADAEFIAASRSAVPALIARVRELEDRLTGPTEEQIEAVLFHRWNTITGYCACDDHFIGEAAFARHAVEVILAASLVVGHDEERGEG